MASIFFKNSQGWMARGCGEGLSVSRGGVRPLSGRARRGFARLERVSTEGAARYALIVHPDTTALVNGYLIPSIKVLCHRDEVEVEGFRFYFTAESPACVYSWDAGKPGTCGRCHALLHGDVAGCACGLTFHQTAELDCFTYAAYCPRCGMPTTLTADFSWLPEEVASCP
jgi:hypothetical protein